MLVRFYVSLFSGKSWEHQKCLPLCLLQASWAFLVHCHGWLPLWAKCLNNFSSSFTPLLINTRIHSTIYSASLILVLYQEVSPREWGVTMASIVWVWNQKFATLWKYLVKPRNTFLPTNQYTCDLIKIFFIPVNSFVFVPRHI